MSHCSATRGLLATDLVILNHGQVTRMTPELTPTILTTTPHQRETFELSTDLTCNSPHHGGSLSGTELELVTRQPLSDTLTTMLPRPYYRAARGLFSHGPRNFEIGRHISLHLPLLPHHTNGKTFEYRYT
ncbi:UNVERIFIED_CONTAM: hypothetical protein NCL1_53128 [Trichonephila clavipes]